MRFLLYLWGTCTEWKPLRLLTCLHNVLMCYGYLIYAAEQGLYSVYISHVPHSDISVPQPVKLHPRWTNITSLPLSLLFYRQLNDIEQSGAAAAAALGAFPTEIYGRGWPELLTVEAKSQSWEHKQMQPHCTACIQAHIQVQRTSGDTVHTAVLTQSLLVLLNVISHWNVTRFTT